jgi:hypothetical protein
MRRKKVASGVTYGRRYLLFFLLVFFKVLRQNKKSKNCPRLVRGLYVEYILIQLQNNWELILI